MYDLVAGSSNLVPSKFLTSLETLSHLPTMAKDMEGKSLKGSVSVLLLLWCACLCVCVCSSALSVEEVIQQTTNFSSRALWMPLHRLSTCDSERGENVTSMLKYTHNTRMHTHTHTHTHTHHTYVHTYAYSHTHICARSSPPQIMYYDGQFNDARLNVALACSSAAAGATVLNYTECKKLIKVRDECKLQVPINYLLC